MARDPEQTFYYHNQLLTRFLVSATVVFLVVVMLVWWQDKNREHTEATPPLVVTQFSTVAAMADATKAYAFGARYIHDIETFPAIRERFFADTTLSFSDSESLKNALAEVQNAHIGLNEGMRLHVYYTSYYVGNLLVLPGKTLQELLLEGRPNTSILLEAALADVRAGAIKIGEYYDVAPPSAYDATFANAVYYPAPSAPSLTVSEAAIVLYVLAELDKTHARMYEQQLADYANHVLAAGANFASDIQAAIDLALVYRDIMVSDPSYVALIKNAREEWNNLDVGSVERIEPLVSNRFSIKGFPYREGVFVDQIINEGYTPSRDETMSGELRLTLRDTRIPSAVSRIYGVSLERGGVLPLDLNIQKRQYSFLRDSLEHASYNDLSEYVAVSQDQESAILVRKQGTSINQVTGITLSYPVTDLEVRYDIGRLVAAEADSLSHAKRIQFAELNDTTAKVTMTLEEVTDPQIYDGERFFVTKSGVVMIVNSMDGMTHVVEGVVALPRADLESTRQTWYFHEQDLLVTADSRVDSTSLIPMTRISLHTLHEGSEQDPAVLTANLVYAVTFQDAQIEDLVVSPSGRYIAMVSTESLGSLEPNLLIFDTMNGIIKKEIDLSDFVPGAVSLDTWLSL